MNDSKEASRKKISCSPGVWKVMMIMYRIFLMMFTFRPTW